MVSTKMKLQQHTKIILYTGVVAVWGGALSAQSFDEDTIVVTANRIEQDSREVTSAVTSFTSDDINLIQPHTFDDLFRSIPGVEFSGGPRVVGEQLQIRAQGGDEITVRIDNARQNFVSGHSGQRFFVDPYLLESAEVNRGAKSHLFGSGAAGVVNLQTLSPSSFLQEGKQVGGRIQAGFQGVNSEQTYSLVFATGNDELKVLAGYVYRDANDIELGNGLELDNSAIDRQNFIFNTEYTPNDEHTFKLGYN